MMDLSPLDALYTHATPIRVAAPKPAISVVGLGYVGAVSCACLSSLGHRVIGVDLDKRKVEDIAAGRSPIHEKGLGELLAAGVEEQVLTATDDLASAVMDTDVTFVSVGTPTAPDGGCDYSYIEVAAESMAKGLARKSGFHVFAMRCSIPPGTTMRVMTPILERGSGKRLGADFGVSFNPEFLREGVAVDDFHAQPKTVIGATCDRTSGIMRQIYEPVDDAPLLTDIETAEIVKYVDNVWHAAKVCFANEVGRLSRSQGVDSHRVMEIFCQDTKLNLSPYYLKPGFAYGGSCLPKEVRAVAHIGKGAGVSLPLVEALTTSNDEQIAEATRLAIESGARRVAILGLAFKPGTDDLRESPILEVIAQLRDQDIEVVCHDPAITRDTPIAGQLAYVMHGSPGLAALASDLPRLLCDTAEDAVAGAEAVIVTHKNGAYAELAADLLSASDTDVIDVVRLFDTIPAAPTYHGIGW
ncbi:MAG: nucleotide sugar dehydrogenase [Pseudomonadota bacterium]